MRRTGGKGNAAPKSTSSGSRHRGCCTIDARRHRPPEPRIGDRTKSLRLGPLRGSHLFALPPPHSANHCRGSTDRPRLLGTAGPQASRAIWRVSRAVTSPDSSDSDAGLPPIRTAAAAAQGL